MTPQERANELIEKFNGIYTNTDWTNIALKSIDDLIASNTDANYVQYWNNVKNIIINRSK
jgi:hypothetical protein